MTFKVLFNKNGKPITSNNIQKQIHKFSPSYDRGVRSIIENSDELTEGSFKNNVVMLLKNFKMTRQGVFKRIDIKDPNNMTDPKNIKDPAKVIQRCWDETQGELKQMKALLQTHNEQQKTRILLLLYHKDREQLFNLLWSTLKKKLLPITMSENSYGLVGASKILFAIFPEIALPVDNKEWKQLFKTVDYEDVLRLMTEEIRAWENATGENLDDCDNCDNKFPRLTLPAIYNVMAMEARYGNIQKKPAIY